MSEIGPEITKYAKHIDNFFTTYPCKQHKQVLVYDHVVQNWVAQHGTFLSTIIISKTCKSTSCLPPPLTPDPAAAAAPTN